VRVGKEQLSWKFVIRTATLSGKVTMLFHVALVIRSDGGGAGFGHRQSPRVLEPCV
jgi:hypothetical protein